MSYRPNEIDHGRTEVCYVMEEVTAATLVAPSAAGGILPISSPEFTQAKPTIMDEQRRPTRSIGDDFEGKRSAATGTIPAYLPIPATLGTAPQWAALATSLFGIETIVGATSVVYTLEDDVVEPNTLSAHYFSKIGQRVLLGACVNEATISYESGPADGASILQTTWTLMAPRMYEMVKDDLAANVVAGTVVTSSDFKKFQINTRIQINDGTNATIDDNTAAGFLLTVVNASTNVLTSDSSFTGGEAAADDVSIEPWQPGSVTEVGSPSHAGLGTSTINIDGGGDVTLPMLGAEVTIKNGWAIPDDEQTQDGYPPTGRYVPDDSREVTGTFRVYHTPAMGNLRGVHREHLPVALSLEVLDPTGTVAFKIAMPNVRIGEPTISGDARKEMTIPFSARFDAAYADEVTLSLIAP